MLQNAADLSDYTMTTDVRAIKEGITEWQIAAEIDKIYRSEGCRGTVGKP